MMIKTKKISKILAIAIMVSLLFSFGTLSALADTDDPEMVPYLSNYTYIGSANSSYDYCSFDATTANSSFVATGFDDSSDADDAVWSVVSGSVSGVSAYYDYGDYVSGKYVTTGWIEIYNAPVGPASIEVKNPNSSPANATTNFTVVADATISTPASSVDVEIYTTAYDATPDSSGTLSNVYQYDFYGNTHYPSVMDSVVRSLYGSIIDSYAYSSMYNSYFVTEMEVDDTDYVSNNDTGWQYRVYDSSGDMMSLSEFVGTDEFLLEGGETVVWVYAAYGSANFPSSI